MFKTKLSRAILVGAIAVGVLSGISVFNFAYGEVGGSGTPQAPQVPIHSISDILKIFCNAAWWFLTFVFLVATLAILWAAFKYITAGGEEKNVTEAKQILVYAVIGIVVALIAFSVIDVVYTFMATGSGGNVFQGICPNSGGGLNPSPTPGASGEPKSPHGGSCQSDNDCVQGSEVGCMVPPCIHICEGNICLGGEGDSCTATLTCVSGLTCSPTTQKCQP